MVKKKDATLECLKSISDIREKWKKEDSMIKKHPRANTKVYAYHDIYPAKGHKLNGERMEFNMEAFVYEKGREFYRFWDTFYNYISFVDLADVDKVQRKALEKWLDGQTCPLIPGVESSCYSHDYARFHDSFIRGKVAPITD